MDVSLVRAQGLVNARADLQRRQAALFAEAAEALASLPAHQRFDFTFWGLRIRSRGCGARMRPTHRCCLTMPGGPRPPRRPGKQR
jgi:hypothetical protein